MWYFQCLSLEISLQLLFSPFLFSSYSCSVDLCVVSVVSAHCNLPRFVLFMKSSSNLIGVSTISSMLVSLFASSFLNIVTSLFSCLGDIYGILIFIVPDTSATKYVNEQKFIIRPIYPSLFVRDMSRIIMIKNCIDYKLRNYCCERRYQNDKKNKIKHSGDFNHI